jgi:hypothetical protein
MPIFFSILSGILVFYLISHCLTVKFIKNDGFGRKLTLADVWLGQVYVSIAMAAIYAIFGFFYGIFSTEAIITAIVSQYIGVCSGLVHGYNDKFNYS